MTDEEFEKRVTGAELQCKWRKHFPVDCKRTWLDLCKASLRNMNLTSNQYERALIRYMKALEW